MPNKGRGPTSTPTRPYKRPLNRPASACLKCGCVEFWADRRFKTHWPRCHTPQRIDKQREHQVRLTPPNQCRLKGSSGVK